ncbi:DMT family transporter [Clostridium sp.]|jgi:bacterial/archaeal transporter family-2 protein|uniref:DMT family transporter n=1 Tax=Clostridium sp. TaxID=1506 RepID=UPI0039F51C14
MIYIILAFASGVLTLLSMIVNSSLGKRIGEFQSSFVNFFVGVISALILVLIIERKISFSEKLHGIPIWAYLGGFLGVMVVIISNIIIPKIPTIYSTLLIFIGQLFTGIVLDYLTGMEISKGKVVGGLLILAGMAYNSMIDRKELEENGHE